MSEENPFEKLTDTIVPLATGLLASSCENVSEKNLHNPLFEYQTELKESGNGASYAGAAALIPAVAVTGTLTVAEAINDIPACYASSVITKIQR